MLDNWDGPAQAYHTETGAIPVPPIQTDGTMLFSDIAFLISALVSSAQWAAGFIMNIGHRLDAIIGRVNLMGTAMFTLARRVEVIENMKGGGNNGMGPGRTRGYQNIAQLGNDKSGFRLWHERFINEVTQVHPAAREVIKGMNTRIEWQGRVQQ